MCGICGVLNTDLSPADAGMLGKMVAAIRHRGPDDCGVYTEGNVGLGHARLSIIDVAGGHQPMRSSDGDLAITFNGEIFNYIELREELEKRGHRFATSSDTEVILHQYEEDGEQCVRRFNGQWAFAIWDRRMRRLFLSRDRMGIRPLYYTQTRRGFLFASEMKALLAQPSVRAEFDLRALDQVFTFWTTIAPRTAFKGIWQLPPGCSAVVDERGVRVERYWSLSFPEEKHRTVEEERELACELRELLLDATRIRLRADVPVGCYLSGGIDSTVTTALAAHVAGDRLRSFSIAFADAEYDERRFQQEASEFLKTDHSSFCCSAADIAEIFPEVVRHAEQPVLRTAPAPMLLLSRLVRESGFKVVLTGEGADEVLGGYDIFKEAKIRRFWARDVSSRWRPLLLKRLYPYMDGLQRQSPAYLRHFFRVSEGDLGSPFFSHLPRWELTARLKLLLSEDVRNELRDYDAFEEMKAALPSEYWTWHPFHQAEYLEATGLLPGYILSSQGDRMAMAHGVEGRFPFLDHRVVDFAAKLPPNLKMKGLREKYLLKRACAEDVPASILKRTKQPYRAPDGKCFFGADAPEYVEQCLSHRAVRDGGVFDANAVGVLKAKFQSGRQVSTRDNMALVGVLSTQLLLNQFAGRQLDSCTQWGSELRFATSS
ncbi:asparagine synthase (glutamine-hydrolyzing) [Occallatibacter savannae]|uniref:asparagine synthase (glutamine-hydrolyzing) n=1 Tax=Occallatibacter savannae TaxID=1002691 RepID=UPI000D69FF91|nr:asparagine synthase (glutamine-hydrolyzing) [Occallatibacter savannae]